MQGNRDCFKSNVAQEVAFIQEFAAAIKGGDEIKKAELSSRFYADYYGTIKAYIYHILEKRGYNYIELSGKLIDEGDGGNFRHGGSLCDEVTHAFPMYLFADTNRVLSKYRGDRNAKFTTYVHGACGIFILDWFTKNPESYEWKRDRGGKEDLPDGLRVGVRYKHKKTSDDQGLLWVEEPEVGIVDISTTDDHFTLSDEAILELQKNLQYGMVKGLLLLSKTHPADARLIVMDLAGEERKKIAQVLGKPTPNALSQAKKEATKRFTVAYKQVLRRTYNLDTDNMEMRANITSVIGR